MTKIVYRQGDALKGPERILVHGCNIQGVMNSGIAKQVRQTYPYAFEEYNRRCVASTVRLGSLVTVNVPEPLMPNGRRIIVNMITQPHFGYDKGKVYASYDAIQLGFRNLDAAMHLFGDPSYAVAMPMIGAGLGGGDWGVIETIIEDNSENFTPVVYRL